MVFRAFTTIAVCVGLCMALSACNMQTLLEEYGVETPGQGSASSASSSQASSAQTDDASSSATEEDAQAEDEENAEEEPSASEASDEPSAELSSEPEEQPSPAAASVDASGLNLTQDFRESFKHGSKPASCQKYIVLHDTEGDSDAASVIDYWDGNGAGVAAHFIVNKDGSVVQCVPLDEITHHAGFGDTGHNAQYGVEDESRDDKVGTVPIGDWAADYGMNSYSIGIEMVHVGGSGYYPEEQLEALDRLIAYIDDYYGFESAIIDHKSWRSGNSDTSPEFAGYFANYQDHRTHS